MSTGSTPPDANGHDAPFAEFKRLDPVGPDGGGAVLTFLARAGHRVDLRLSNDQLATLGSAIDLRLRRSPSPPPFPLDAEQIVRGLGFLAAWHFDRTRKPGDDPIGHERMTLAIGRFLGVALPTTGEPNTETAMRGRIAGRTVLLPYGAKPDAEEKPARPTPQPAPPRNPGGLDAA